jgi:hypothetical protein
MEIMIMPVDADVDADKIPEDRRRATSIGHTVRENPSVAAGAVVVPERSSSIPSWISHLEGVGTMT